MAELTTLARPYAKAAFEFALQEGCLQKWSEMLKLLTAVSMHSSIKHMVATPILTKVQKANAFFEICGDELDESGRNFVSVVAYNKRLQLLPEISLIFEQLKANQEKTVDVELTTAYELSEETYANLTRSLSAKLAREINVNTSIDSTLLGGVVVRTGDLVIDGSVRGKLAKLAEQLNK